jgi:hypothetical protein
MNSRTGGVLRLLGVLALAIVCSSVAIGTAVAPLAFA